MFSKFPYIAIALTEHVDSIYICILIIVLTNSHKKSRIKTTDIYSKKSKEEI